MKVKVTSQGDSQDHVFDVSTKGNEKTIIKTIAPTRDLGRDMLMVEQNMWAFIPNLKRAVRVSLSQKLTGEAANGDISRMRWAQDYDAKIEKEDAKAWTLFLTANKQGLTYEKVRARVEKKTFRPLDAEYLTKADKVLKNAKFESYKPIAGETRPTVIAIQDAVQTDKSTRIEIESITVKDLPDSLFSVERFSSR
ncbi:outer membrane lipoprotein-sorting protein [bacterium]|nr:outer membrane lipoprotein-sorting protein [bacterium]